MRILGVLLILLILFGLFKIYMIRGVLQATDNRTFVWVYGSISIGTLLLGLLTMRTAFGAHTLNMSFWPNFIIALMMSIVICEVILALFFLIDDIVLLIQSINRRIGTQLPGEGINRRRVIKTIGLAVTAVPFASYLYGITRGKYDYKVFRQTLKFPDLPDAFDGFTIAQFSDFHSGSFDSAEQVKKGLDLLQKQGADLILFTGDLVNELADEVLPYKGFLKSLSAPYGKYAVLGNHDYPGGGRGPSELPEADKTKVQDIMLHHQDCGFELLNNTHTKIERDGSFLRLIGVENWGTRFVKHGDLEKALAGTQNEDFSILLSHDPTHWEEKVLPHPNKIHLTLSGHTHGLQMGIELPNFKWSPIKYIYQRWAGIYQEKGQYLYVNRGFGFIGFAGRVGIKPEIALITLKKA